VTAIMPGPIATPIYAKTGLTKEAADAFSEQIKSKVPLQRFGSAEEAARAALFLASDDAAFVTGHELTVDGGLLVA
jgi:NAD(P)-dependent dehydrogenase (short-subunit alcohol dehydrogenase family)